jgi:predicted nucleic acid-binding protein/Arc/MetJ family transcription regulator
VDVDDSAGRIVMDRYHLATKRDAVNFALRTVAAEPPDLDQARALRGPGRRSRRLALRSRPVILIDTSGWVEFLRDTASPICQRVDDLLAEGFVVCEPVRMEVLAGATGERHLNDLRPLLARGTLITTEPTDYEEAASLYRVCRRNGETVRTMIDCLIASVLIRSGSPLLHADRDFDVVARHTPWEIDRSAS